MANQLKPLLINNTENDVTLRDFYDLLVEVEGDGGGNTSSLEGYYTVTARPYNYNTINPAIYAQQAREMGILLHLQLCVGRDQFLPLLPWQLEDLDGIVVSMDQNNRLSARLVPGGRNYPYQLLRYWFPFLETFWIRKRIDDILGAQGERLIFQPFNPNPVPISGVLEIC